ncbi:MAG: hypothetical protein P8H13_01900 [Polaribacter sp.]|nr:hypothetical protein [Polaribacter sp.]MDG1810674.1 hypothetical protein [Polaribacter sp.]MDG1993523.1 hypothetical protein [Polaribacter sp.]
MKKIIFMLAFMLIGTAAFATNEIKKPNYELNKVENIKVTISNTSYIITNLDDPKLNEKLFDCTVEYDITIWYPGSGGPIRLKGTVTVKGKSCIEILKEAIK